MITGEGQEFDFETTLTYSPRGKVKDHISFSDWIKAINKHSADSLETSYLGVHLQGETEEFRKNVSDIKCLWFPEDQAKGESRQSCVLTLGRFTGFLSKNSCRSPQIGNEISRPPTVQNW